MYKIHSEMKKYFKILFKNRINWVIKVSSKIKKYKINDEIKINGMLEYWHISIH